MTAIVRIAYGYWGTIFAGIRAGVGTGIGAASAQQTGSILIILSVSYAKGAGVDAVISVIAGLRSIVAIARHHL